MAADIVRTGKKRKEPEKQLQRNENVSEEILTFDFFFLKDNHHIFVIKDIILPVFLMRL